LEVIIDYFGGCFMAKADLRDLFLRTQQRLLSDLKGNQPLGTPGAKGGATELDWVTMLTEHLPWRYQVANQAFVVDASGVMSEEIDVVIHDRQYTPLLYSRNDRVFIPAEGVYAVFEVKPSLTRDNVKYAGGKAGSVRKLTRTSAPFPHAEGVSQTEPGYILSGILCTESVWSPPLGDPLKNVLAELSSDECLDLGCALEHGSFEVFYEDSGQRVVASSGETALLFFFLRLLSRLRALRTVSASDWDEYGRVLADDWQQI
jgi:hypothetical protein